MAKKIVINGKEYNFEDSDELKNFISSHMNGASNDGFSITSNGTPNISVFTEKNILSNGNTYKSFNDLPEETKQKIRENLGKLKDNAFAKKIIKMYGLDIDSIENNLIQNSDNNQLLSTPMNKDDYSFNNSQKDNDNQFGGSSFGPSNPQMNTSSAPVKMYTAGGGGGSGKWIVIVILLVVVGFCGGIFYLVGFVGQSWAETYALKGDPTHFDPFEGVSEARAVIDPNAKLSELTADYIKSDGTMDLTASYHANVTYNFYKLLAAPPKDAPPIGAGGSKDGKWYEPVEADVYEPGQFRSVMKMGGGVSTSYTYSNLGIDLDSSDPTATPNPFIDDPKCSIKDFWKEAIKQKAPADAVASLEYSYNTDGYEFSIRDTDIRLDFDKNCKLKDDGSSAIDPLEVQPPIEPIEPTK